MTEFAVRREIVAAVRQLEQRGLTQGTSGNISARFGDGMVITPSAIPYADMVPGDLVAMSFDGTIRNSRRGHRPSTEWLMHAYILTGAPDVNAIVHAHPPSATALSCLRRDIPAFHYMVAVAGGTVIKCSEYATFGTRELADAAILALGERRACLLANHGIIACGVSVTGALSLAVEVEALAEHYTRALSVGEPTLLTSEEMDRVMEEFESYGR